MKKYKGYALITGGSDGIGLAYAKWLAKEGYNLVLVARDKKKLNAAASLIKKSYKIEVETISQDLSKPESADKICDYLDKKKISVGVLINNASINALGLFNEIPKETHQNMINISCLSSMNLTYRLLPGMLKKRSGAIIFVSSIAANFSGYKYSIYGACKAFQLKFAQGLHGEYKDRGIDVLAVCPDVVKTNFFKASRISEPSTQPIEPEDVAQATFNALGKKIVVTIPATFSTRLATLLVNIMPYEILEKATKMKIKDMWGI